MKPTLEPGAKVTFTYTVAPSKTVPALYPEAPEFQTMPAVLATGFMVGLLEWGCVKVLAPHLDAGEGSLGIHVDFSHVAATVPGQTVTVVATCTAVEGRKVSFEVEAHDGVDVISRGKHQRMVVPWDKFTARVNAKAKAAGVPGL
ncbi:MAG: thioesterase family protein [Hyphomicrobiaceae bacterium]